MVRQRMGLTVEELGLEAGVGSSTIRGIENGRDAWMSSYIGAADALNMDLGLLPRSVAPAPPKRLRGDRP